MNGNLGRLYGLPFNRGDSEHGCTQGDAVSPKDDLSHIYQFTAYARLMQSATLQIFWVYGRFFMLCEKQNPGHPYNVNQDVVKFNTFANGNSQNGRDHPNLTRVGFLGKLAQAVVNSHHATISPMV